MVDDVIQRRNRLQMRKILSDAGMLRNIIEGGYEPLTDDEKAELAWLNTQLELREQNVFDPDREEDQAAQRYWDRAVAKGRKPYDPALTIEDLREEFPNYFFHPVSSGSCRYCRGSEDGAPICMRCSGRTTGILATEGGRLSSARVAQSFTDCSVRSANYVRDTLLRLAMIVDRENAQEKS